MDTGEQTAVETARAPRRGWRALRLGLFALLAMLAVGILVVWLTRERIADNIIADLDLVYIDLDAAVLAAG